MARTIREGKVKKGGQNEAPLTERPAPPGAQEPVEYEGSPERPTRPAVPDPLIEATGPGDAASVIADVDRVGTLAPIDALTTEEIARLVTDNWDAPDECCEGSSIAVGEDDVFLSHGIGDVSIPRAAFDELVRWYFDPQPLEEKAPEVEILELPEDES
jgi:hypothetical protein